MGNRRKYVRRDATVEKLSAIYLSDKTGKVKESTLKCYQFNIRKYILPHLGNRVAAEVTVDDVDDYMEMMLEHFSPKLSAGCPVPSRPVGAGRSCRFPAAPAW